MGRQVISCTYKCMKIKPQILQEVRKRHSPLLLGALDDILLNLFNNLVLQLREVNDLPRLTANIVLGLVFGLQPD